LTVNELRGARHPNVALRERRASAYVAFHTCSDALAFLLLEAATDGARIPRSRPVTWVRTSTGRTPVKGAQKPKKLQKKVAQKSLKERRSEKRAAGTKGRATGL
jgi:hypothetical protein